MHPQDRICYLWPGDAIWHNSGSALAQVVACCLRWLAQLNPSDDISAKSFGIDVAEIILFPESIKSFHKYKACIFLFILSPWVCILYANWKTPTAKIDLEEDIIAQFEYPRKLTRERVHWECIIYLPKFIAQRVFY